MLERDPAPAGEQLPVERAQAVGAAVDVWLPCGLAGIAVGFEGLDDGVRVARGERPLVLADDVALLHGGVRL